MYRSTDPSDGESNICGFAHDANIPLVTDDDAAATPFPGPGSSSSSTVKLGRLYVDGRPFFGHGFYVHGLNATDWRYLQSACLLYTSPSPRDKRQSRMPSSA